MTSGNPFFVAEVLAAGDGDRVPSTVADAVLARVRRLDPATRDALEQLAVVPSVVERWLVDALVAAGWPRWRRPRSAACSRCRRPRWGSARARPPGGGGLGAGGARVELNRRVLQALAGREAPTCRASSTTRLRPATATRSSAMAAGGPGRGRRRRPP